MRRTLAIWLLAGAAWGLGAWGAAAAEPRRTADPGGGPGWSARVSETGGRTCAVVRQGRAGKGRYCARLGPTAPYFYTVRYDLPVDRRRWRSVFVITLTRAVLSARLTTPDGTVRYRRGIGPKVLLAVVAGRVELPPLVVRVRTATGRVVVARGGGEPAAQVADPLGEQEWRTVAERRSRDRACVAWQRVPPRFGGPEAQPAEGGFRCGPRGASVVAAGVDAVAGRTVVTALLGRAVRRVALRGPGAPRIAFDPAARSAIAVLPGAVAPADLTLVATLRGGATVEHRLG